IRDFPESNKKGGFGHLFLWLARRNTPQATIYFCTPLFAGLILSVFSGFLSRILHQPISARRQVHARPSLKTAIFHQKQADTLFRVLTHAHGCRSVSVPSRQPGTISPHVCQPPDGAYAI
ncbi:hypothetical protein, partial [Rivihabitans pingtungensis]|uniref:hypothetical protein n=1 Tax=Rivihabitans pingtungensis TaxID=1054498 RepID=UPI0023F4EAA2